ncbi:MAG TPA: 3-phosphoshikimate 1-carboxyvinyltransferase [Salinivirgaceae bacterium]|nr:3-phosphoshikimate 1-carboxyvinyltransferase [Salinivirgaceae bacterium]HQA76238.1 3-phosphoshikimate 1-carboxyvinyltransferase [Salinivirgaceae bacterium]
MKKKICSSTVKGTVQAPASKSVAQRAIALATLAEGVSTIKNVGSSDDVLATINVCKRLGAEISGNHKLLTVKGGLKSPTETLNCGESGLCIRMFSPIVATLDSSVVMTGEGTLKKRPMQMIADSLTQLGATCLTNNGFLPLKIKGPIKGGEINIDGSISSQVLTGLLMATPFAETDTIIKVDNLKSTPYIDLTIRIMQDFGVDVININYEKFLIKSSQKYRSVDYEVEGDWSGAAFLLVAGAIAGEVEVTNIFPNSYQADRAIIEALKLAGADVVIKQNSVKVLKNSLVGFDFDATNCPDLFPPLVALATHCQGKTAIAGIDRLKNKESDRATTLKQEFEKFGIKIELANNAMTIHGAKLKSASLFSHDDHRIAMACATAALSGNCTVEIENAEAVNKSYPNFFDDLKTITQ